MAYPAGKVAGTLFFVAAAQFTFCIVIAEALYPGYSVSAQYISDLGTGPSAMVFNSSAFLLGLLVAVGGYFLWRIRGMKIACVLFFVSAIGAMGIGVFTSEYTLVHGVLASATFFFVGLSAILSARGLRIPFSLISVALGAVIIAALALFSLGMYTSGSLTSDIAYDSVYYLGLGPGGMERMIIYPALVWLAGFGGYLTAIRER